MHNYYKDILDLTDREPLWFDEHAVPRFVDFSPMRIASIYADECALVEIACQSCDALFHVAMSTSNGRRTIMVAQALNYAERVGAIGQGAEPPRGEAFYRRLNEEISKDTLAASIRNKAIHFGDPPNIECCPAGPTMNSVPLRVVEYWERPIRDWKRNQQLELAIDPDWVHDEDQA